MNLYGYEFQRDSDLVHYGIIGMKWGVRRYQNADGTLTDEGKRHIGRQVTKEIDYINKEGTSTNNAGVGPTASHLLNKLKDVYKQPAKEYRKAWQAEAQFKEDHFWKNDKVFEKYANKRIDKSIADGYVTESERANMLWLMKNDDLGQGLFEEWYLPDNPKVAKEYDKLVEKTREAFHKDQEAKKKVADIVLGEYANSRSSKVIVGKKWNYGKQGWDNIYAKYSTILDDEIDKRTRYG